MKIADMKVTELINEVGSGTPAPGGGAVAGLAGGVGVALTMMVNGLTLDKKGFENDRERLLDAIAKGNELKERFIDVMNRDSEVFDTLIAVIAGLMIIPVVYMFAVKTGVTPELIAQHNGDAALATKAAVKSAMNAGPGLMFITLPKVFATLGAVGPWIGLAFFVLVVFAAATSAISLFEACVASVCDVLHIERKAATFFTTALIMFLATFSAIGYGPWKMITIGGMPFLDFFDFITNSVLMPITAAATCIFVGWILTPKSIIDEVEAEGNVFKAKGLYVVMVKWFAPALVIAILVSEICRALGIGGWKI